MKVLITGATGYIGRAVAQRLLAAGYDVTGLVRNELGVRTLTTAGIEPVHGALDDADSLRAAVEGADAVIETASADHAASTTALLKAIAAPENASSEPVAPASIPTSLEESPPTSSTPRTTATPPSPHWRPATAWTSWRRKPHRRATTPSCCAPP